jgi:EAL domain-containing protein (putative c-di-GMP-specific phosphodiesterase class I)
LLRHADVALYKAKDQGRNGFQFFEAEMTTYAYENLLLESALRVAVSRNELRVHYQPQVNLANGELCGVEALVRWQHPVLGLIPPGQFIPLAEAAGVIGMIGEWVMRESCRQMMAWEAQGFHMPRVSVNLSVQQINRDTLLPMVAVILRESGLSSDRLELEVTESMLMRQADMACGVLDDLLELGVKLAIDDFGTGYSSLAYLNKLPMHRLKIDQSFVRGIGRDKNADAIVRAIIALARSLGLETVAEGVEEQSQADFLARELCDVCQGFLFSRPVEADEILSLQGHAMKIRFLISTLLALSFAPAFAGEKEDATALVNEAAAAVSKDKAAAIAVISNKTGRFVKGELYVFAYDMNGVMVAHPINAKLIGKNLLEVPDADGKLFRKEIISSVQASGSASVGYKYKNPQSGKVEDKISFCKKAADLAVCAGYYK